MRKKLYVCFICERRYAELEEAEVCERSHEPSPKPAPYVPGWAVK